MVTSDVQSIVWWRYRAHFSEVILFLSALTILTASAAHAGTNMVAIAAYTPRGKEIYREETHVELARQYERVFVWKKAAYELQFEFGPDMTAPPVGLLVLQHPHALSRRPYTVTIMSAPFEGTLDPGEVVEYPSADGLLTFKVWYPEEATATE